MFYGGASQFSRHAEHIIENTINEELKRFRSFSTRIFTTTEKTPLTCLHKVSYSHPFSISRPPPLTGVLIMSYFRRKPAVPRLRRSICSRYAKPGPRAGAGGSDGGEEGIERRRRGWRRALPREWHGGQGRTRTRLY